MLMGALIGLLVGTVLIAILAQMNIRYVERYNANPINQALRRKATYKPNPLNHAIVAAIPTLIGAIIGGVIGH